MRECACACARVCVCVFFFVFFWGGVKDVCVVVIKAHVTSAKHKKGEGSCRNKNNRQHLYVIVVYAYITSRGIYKY